MSQGLRIDRSHDPLVLNTASSHFVHAQNPVALVSLPSSRQSIEQGQAPSDAESVEIRHAHLDDLTIRLQAWAADLDAREARLNAREALLEHRERTLRVQSVAVREECERLQAAKQAYEKQAHEKTLAEEQERLKMAARGEWLGQLRIT